MQVKFVMVDNNQNAGGGNANHNNQTSEELYEYSP
jgi:hypothetical protein